MLVQLILFLNWQFTSSKSNFGAVVWAYWLFRDLNNGSFWLFNWSEPSIKVVLENRYVIWPFGSRNIVETAVCICNKNGVSPRSQTEITNCHLLCLDIPSNSLSSVLLSGNSRISTNSTSLQISLFLEVFLSWAMKLSRHCDSVMLLSQLLWNCLGRHITAT